MRLKRTIHDIKFLKIGSTCPKRYCFKIASYILILILFIFLKKIYY
jgi:hypothetical protein